MGSDRILFLQDSRCQNQPKRYRVSLFIARTCQCLFKGNICLYCYPVPFEFRMSPPGAERSPFKTTAQLQPCDLPIPIVGSVRALGTFEYWVSMICQKVRYPEIWALHKSTSALIRQIKQSAKVAAPRQIPSVGKLLQNPLYFLAQFCEVAIQQHNVLA
jgi:hypothetical protein